jgi:hypothetical protein
MQHGVDVGWRLLRVTSFPHRPPGDLAPPGRCRFSRELGKVSRLSCRWSSVVGVVEGGLSAHPSCL